MKTRIVNTKNPAYKLNIYRNIFYNGKNRLEEMNELMRAQQNMSYEYKLKLENKSSERLMTQVWWKD